MKILLSVFIVGCLLLFNSCREDINPVGNKANNVPLAVVITMTAGNTPGGTFFIATPTEPVFISKLSVAVPLLQFQETYNGDGLTIFPANVPFIINEYQGVATGQKWTFFFDGNLGTKTGTPFSIASSFTVP